MATNQFEFVTFTLEEMLAVHRAGLEFLPNMVCSLETWKEYTRQVYGEHSLIHIESVMDVYAQGGEGT